MTLDFSSLRRAVGQLETSLAYARSDMARDDPALATQFRAATIQAFGCTYERVTGSLRRWLIATEASPDEVDALTFPGLIRLAHARGLVREDVSRWRVFRDRRGTTSHAYDEAKAQQVFDAIPQFLDEARHVAEQLERRATQA